MKLHPLLRVGSNPLFHNARHLLDAGANVGLADRSGTSPIALARSRGYREMVAILERAGARE